MYCLYTLQQCKKNCIWTKKQKKQVRLTFRSRHSLFTSKCRLIKTVCSWKTFYKNQTSGASLAKNDRERVMIPSLVYHKIHATVRQEVARSQITGSLIKMFAVETIVFTWTAQTQLSLKGLYVAPLVPQDKLFLPSPVTWFLWQAQCKTTMWVNGPGMPLRGSGMCGMTNTGQ